jgi:hypothetical protein
VPPILFVRILPKRPCQIEFYRFPRLSAWGQNLPSIGCALIIVCAPQSFGRGNSAAEGTAVVP